MAQNLTRHRQMLLASGGAFIVLAGVLLLLADRPGTGWPFVAIGLALIAVAVVTGRRGTVPRPSKGRPGG